MCTYTPESGKSPRKRRGKRQSLLRLLERCGKIKRIKRCRTIRLWGTTCTYEGGDHNWEKREAGSNVHWFRNGRAGSFKSTHSRVRRKIRWRCAESESAFGKRKGPRVPPNHLEVQLKGGPNKTLSQQGRTREGLPGYHGWTHREIAHLAGGGLGRGKRKCP